MDDTLNFIDYRVHHLTFLFLQLMLISRMVTLSSCLIWQIISFILPPNECGCVYASLSGPGIDLNADFGKPIIFSDETHSDLGGYVNKQNCRIWGTGDPYAYIKKPTHPQRVTVWCGFWSRSIIGPFFFENKQGETVTVNGDRYRGMLNEFLFTKIEQGRILATFGFNRTALRATQPKLYSMFCVLFLKIALSAAELTSFGLLGAAISHRWTIICEVSLVFVLKHFPKKKEFGGPCIMSTAVY